MSSTAAQIFSGNSIVLENVESDENFSQEIAQFIEISPSNMYVL